MDIQAGLSAVSEFIKQRVKEDSPYSKKLFDAMNYSLSAGGKRLRPMLTLLSYHLFRDDVERIVPVAAAMEMIHTYSLIHDDLPAMDNDDFRRGKPTNHKVFGEAIAILAGDGLLTLAFQIIGETVVLSGLPPDIVTLIAKKSGPYGMVGGQTADMLHGEFPDSSDLLNYIHLRKTSDLITASVLAGAVGAGAAPDDLRRLETYGENLGQAFQIIDDVLDETGNIEALGKTAGKDKEQKKLTFTSIYGMDYSKKTAEQLIHEAEDVLSLYGKKADGLLEIARFILERDH